MRWEIQQDQVTLSLAGHGKTSDSIPSATGHHWRDWKMRVTQSDGQFKSPFQLPYGEWITGTEEGKGQRRSCQGHPGKKDVSLGMAWGAAWEDSGNSSGVELIGLWNGLYVRMKEREKSGMTPSLGRPVMDTGEYWTDTAFYFSDSFKDTWSEQPNIHEVEPRENGISVPKRTVYSPRFKEKREHGFKEGHRIQGTVPGPEDTVTGVPQREGHVSTCAGGGSNMGCFEEARAVTQQKWCIHPTHYPFSRKSPRWKVGRDIWSNSHLVTHFPSFRKALGSPWKKLSTVKIRNMGQWFGAQSLQSRSPGFKSELAHSLTVWLQTGHSSSLILSACKMEQYYLPCRIMGNNTPKGCSTLPAMKQKFSAVFL